MVILLALLVPTHRQVKKWLLHQVMEMNKRFRLKTAKQTLSELDEMPDKLASESDNIEKI